MTAAADGDRGIVRVPDREGEGISTRSVKSGIKGRMHGHVYCAGHEFVRRASCFMAGSRDQGMRHTMLECVVDTLFGKTEGKSS